ncbi:hypothetical protein QC590_19445 [Pseudomonas putida]|uniref:hypothetical protein n=1 Tax=Pseudomonas putida TaxID=303 RepID=UPI00334B1D31
MVTIVYQPILKPMAFSELLHDQAERIFGDKTKEQRGKQMAGHLSVLAAPKIATWPARHGDLPSHQQAS